MRSLLILLSSFIMAGLLTAQTHVNPPLKPEVVFVKGGTFKMGSILGDDDERPVHTETVSDFSIGKYEVTVSQYRLFCEETLRNMPLEPSWGWIDNHPIVNVSHFDAIEYCNWLSKKYGGSWRLPSEAEWEYAAMGGRQSKGFYYAGSNDLNLVGWHYEISPDQTNSVGRKMPNELGLYDMSGNAWEWCMDWYGAYEISSKLNSQRDALHEFRVIRGAGWYSTAIACRVASRSYYEPESSSDGLGFRVVLIQ